jgi:hypothetical protein
MTVKHAWLGCTDSQRKRQLHRVGLALSRGKLLVLPPQS